MSTVSSTGVTTSLPASPARARSETAAGAQHCHRDKQRHRNHPQLLAPSPRPCSGAKAPPAVHGRAQADSSRGFTAAIQRAVVYTAAGGIPPACRAAAPALVVGPSVAVPARATAVCTAPAGRSRTIVATRLPPESTIATVTSSAWAIRNERYSTTLDSPACRHLAAAGRSGSGRVEGFVHLEVPAPPSACA